MTGFAKLTLNGPAANILETFNEAAIKFGDNALIPQISPLENGQFRFSFGKNAVIGGEEDGQVMEFAPLKVVSHSLTDGISKLARDFRGLLDGAYLVTTAPTQEYDTVQRLYRFENGKVTQPAIYIGGTKLG